MKIKISESFKYQILVCYPALNFLNRIVRPSNLLALLRRKKQIAKAFASGKVKLHIGCGRSRLDDSWLHGDIHRGEIFINALKRLPFGKNEVDLIFSEQFIEHLPELKIRRFWNECFRVMKPGGWMRHSTPDLDFYIQLYLGKVEDVTLDMFYSRIRHIRKDTPHRCIYLNEVLSMWGHLFNYNEDYLRKVWEQFGFVNIRRVPYGKSSVAELSNLEQHTTTEWLKYKATLVMEAQKPL